MDLETAKQVLDTVQDEFEGSNMVRSVRILTLQREIELMKMMDKESVKDNSCR